MVILIGHLCVVYLFGTNKQRIQRTVLGLLRKMKNLDAETEKKPFPYLS